MKVYKRIWIIGDKFMTKTYSQHFLDAFGDNGKIGYLRAHYDVSGWNPMGNDFNQNVLSRYRNFLVEAINDQDLFPKAIVLSFEKLLAHLNHFYPGISILIGRSLEWIANQYHRVITAHKEKLPTKSRRFKYPMILWLNLPICYGWSKKDNDFRRKVNDCIRSTTSLFREMDVLEIPFDESDGSLVTKGELNAAGCTAYWHGVNSAFECWDKN